MTDEHKSLRDAIDSLDHSIGAHWTKGGKPDLNALKEMTGRVVKRAEVDEVSSDLRRDTGDGDSEASDEPPKNFEEAKAAAKAKAREEMGLTEAHDGPTDVDNYKTIDFISLMDAIQNAMNENHRIYCPTLYRVMQVYRAEREGVVREFKNATARGRVKIVGPSIPIDTFALAPMQIDDDPDPVDPDATP